MTKPATTFYIIARIPRAGKHNHVHVVPTKTPEPTGKILDDSGISVQRTVEQMTYPYRDGHEILKFVAPKLKLSDEAKEKIKTFLLGCQDRLAEIVTKEIDWDNYRGSGTYQLPELDEWMDQLCQDIPELKLSTITNPDITTNSIGNLIMRNPKICTGIVLITLGILFITVGAIIAQIRFGGATDCYPT